MPWIARHDSAGNILQSWELGNDPLVFGRGEDVGATVADDQMSRKHFEIRFVNDSHIITDQGSTNGTWVNGRKVMHAYLKSNDRILAGESKFRYQVGTSTMLGFVEKEAGTTFKGELQKMYKDVDSKKKA